MRYSGNAENVNLFEHHTIARGLLATATPRCNIGWWATAGNKKPLSWEDLSTLRLYLSEPLVHSLRSENKGYSTVSMDLLKDLYRALYKEEPTKGFVKKLTGGNTKVSFWQWDVFEQIQWRASHGVRPAEVVQELKKIHYRYIEREDIQPQSWDNNPDIRKEWQTLRVQVLEMYKTKCAMCGRSQQEHGVVVHVDHIIPKSRLPCLALCFANLQVLCAECNMGKSNRFDTDWRPEAVNQKEIHQHLDY